MSWIDLYISLYSADYSARWLLKHAQVKRIPRICDLHELMWMLLSAQIVKHRWQAQRQRSTNVSILLSDCSIHADKILFGALQVRHNGSENCHTKLINVQVNTAAHVYVSTSLSSQDSWTSDKNAHAVLAIRCSIAYFFERSFNLHRKNVRTIVSEDETSASGAPTA